MLTVYEASVKNVKELNKQAKTIKRLLNQALIKNRQSDIDALTKTYALMYSAYAEVSFQKLINTPYGFSNDYIKQIQSCGNLEQKWQKCFDFALKSISNEHNKGEIANKTKWLTEIMKKYIIVPSQTRNKIAHGQWCVCLNTDCTAVNTDLTHILSTLDYVQIDRLFNIYEIFVQCIEDLIESPRKAHYRDFYLQLSKLDEYITKTEKYTLDTKKEKLLSSPKRCKRKL